jgi:plasmid stabilization system protein ParE
MDLRWTSSACSDLVRLHAFLSSVENGAAIRTVRALTAAPTCLLEHPRIGEWLEEFAPREVRRLLVGQYELRYEIQGQTIYILRLWHTREER